ncbi:hypothetical protein TSUD_152820, partial [Trifolium subterraneum]
MASTSGTKGPFEISRQPSKRMIRAPTRTVELPNEENIMDSEIVPSSLAVLVPILRAAIEIEEENPRVAYLCRFHAFEKAHTMDPTSSGRGVRQFKTYLLHKLEREGELTEKHTKRSDAKELQNYYQHFYEKRIRDGEFTKKPEEMVKNVQIATVLYEVLKTLLTPQTIEEKTKRYAADVENKRGQYEHYNILPLYAVGVKPAIMELPEIKAAIAALSKVDNLPMPIIHSRPDNDDSTMPMERVKNVNDILDWIASIFGFQKGNVANQREHLILLLANIDIRNRSASYEIREETVENLMATTFKNYESWCHYVRCKSNIRYSDGHGRQQLQLIYIALYLLIWGEASNIRFMPECLCYIFHHMCNDVFGILYSNAYHVSGEAFEIVTRDDEHFLREVITPLYDVLMKEAKRSNKGKASHSNWRNYDDLNEYFWSDKCFKLGWPMNLNSDFFRHKDETQTTHLGRRGRASTGVGKKKPKTNFVEVTLMLLESAAMIIIAWSNLGLIGVLTDSDVFKNVSSIFITYAFLNFLQVTIDIILIWNALRNMKFTQLLRYFLKFVVAAVWVVVLPVSFSSSLQNPTGLIQFVTHWAGDWGPQSIYYWVVAIYMIPNIVAALLFFLPPLRRTLERSNMRLITLLMWWAQPKLYVGRGMHESMFSLVKYTLFWIMLLISKLAFSYYVEISPLVEPTKIIMAMHIDNYQWHEVFPENDMHNLSVVVSIWAPIILVYFMDTQIWYAIYATLFGGIIGAFSHLGEIRTLGMLRSRFLSVPQAFSESFWTGRNRKNMQEESDDAYERDNIAYFSQVWNEFINSMREEDLISNRDRDLLLVPYSSIPIAVDMAKDYKKDDDADLFKKIKSDGYMYSAVVECYETLKDIILSLLLNAEDKKVIELICAKVEECIEEEKFVKEFDTSGLPSLSEKLEKFLSLLRAEDSKPESQIVNVLQDIVEIIIQDVMVDGHVILQTPQHYNVDKPDYRAQQRFVNIDTSFTQKRSVMEKVIRLHLLLTVKESAINVPQNIEARRRITFFANSLFMNMPKAPKVRDMLSFSVLTPYYKENVQYSNDELKKENEDGISILFYLTKIYPVRGMMYYWQALLLQYLIENGGDNGISEGYRTVDFSERDRRLLEQAKALADLKHSALRVAYIDETEDANGGKKVYYSVLVKGGEKYDQEIYRIKLPGPPTEIGEGKPENQNHAIIFTRGEALQTIDMNQDNYYEEAFKMRNVLEEFHAHKGQRKPTILGLREHIFTGSVSSLAWFMSNQETSFVTIGQRITVLTVYVFLYGRLYMVLSGVEREILQNPDIHQSKSLEQALASQSVVQLGLLLVLPMVMEIGLEKGFRTALGDFIIMQLQLASVFFTFQLGTKAHYYGRTLLHGGSKYRPTGRGFVVFHAKFADNYRMYSRSHFVKGLEILILLIIYEVYGESYRSSTLYFFITMSMWFLAISWLFAPFLFNPSGFDWQKTVDDWTDWKRWMGNRGGIGISSDKSWESWWDEENEHLKYSNARGKILEIILACRFFIYQYGIVYHLNIARRSKNILVFALSWAVLIIVLIVLK